MCGVLDFAGYHLEPCTSVREGPGEISHTVVGGRTKPVEGYEHPGRPQRCPASPIPVWHYGGDSLSWREG